MREVVIGGGLASVEGISQPVSRSHVGSHLKHDRLSAADELLGRLPGLLHGLVAAFHNAHDAAEQLLILNINNSLALLVRSRAQLGHVGKPAGRHLADGGLNVHDVHDQVLLVLCADQLQGDVALVVEALLLRFHLI